MRIIEITVYKFSELPQKAQEAAVSNLYDINTDSAWYDYLYDDAESIGLKITGFDDHSATGHFILSPEQVTKNILENHGPGCETVKTAKSYLATKDREDFLQSLLEDYRIMLNKEYDYLTSNEAIIESIEANDYEFTEDGKLI